MIKTILSGILVTLLLISGIWYFFIREYDYSFSFDSEAAPGILYQRVLGWEYEKLQHRENEKSTPFRKIVQNKEINGFPLSLNWQFAPVNDSLTTVTVRVKNTEDPLNRRWNQLFGNDAEKKLVKEEIEKIEETIEADREFYKITFEGEAISPKATCACIKLENEIGNKAFEMMQNINYLAGYVSLNNLEMAGKPRVQVTRWDLETNMIEFNFCFPIKETFTPSEENSPIFITDIEPQTALKATFNGNYMFSHLAWMKLLNYAEIHDIPVEKNPLEIFHDNPEMGGDGLNWTTEIYLPTK